MTGDIMQNYTIIEWLFFFYFYCFLGWCFESAYVSIRTRKLTNRGFIRGPFLPLYGSGGIMMLVVSMPFQDNVVLVFLAGCVGATALEFVTGVTMEALFDMRYWDYSDNKFNFKGYICLKATLMWGFCTVMMTQFLHVPVEKFVLSLPAGPLEVVTIVLTVLIAMDFALSFKAAIDLRNVLVKMSKTKEELVRIQRRLDVIVAFAGQSLGSRREAWAENMDELKSGIEAKLESIRKLIQSRTDAYPDSVKEEVQELKTDYNVNVEMRSRLSRIRDFFQRDMIRSNPTMTSQHFKEDLEELKQQVSAGKK